MYRLAERKIVKLAKKKEVEIQHVHRRVLDQLSKTPVHEVSRSSSLPCTRLSLPLQRKACIYVVIMRLSTLGLRLFAGTNDSTFWK